MNSLPPQVITSEFCSYEDKKLGVAIGIPCLGLHWIGGF
jgi:hypothetical protein